jgi:nitrate reductase NapD
MTSPTRRQVLSGRTPSTPQRIEIASAVVTAWPDHLDGVAEAILALGNTEIHARDPKGKLVVVIEGPTVGVVGTTVNVISDIQHVLSAVMVFQASDDEQVAS